jgi:hypothetical protein
VATRRERVVLDLVDNYTPGMAKAAAVTAMLNRELNSLSGSSIQADRSTAAFTRSLSQVSREAQGADRSINQLTGRLRLFADLAAVLGPSLAPVGGVLTVGVAGLANQMGFAAVAAGVLIGSLQGVGDALGAMNDAALDPSDKNLEKAEEALKRLSPAAREFAEAAFDLKPALLAIRDLGAESLVPGLTESLDNLERLGPRVGGIFEAIGGALGDIAADSSASLASERWAGFFEFIEREGPTVLSELAATVGDLTHGLAELWEAFAPLNSDFSSWLMGVADGFDSWASGLSATEGFTEFVDYIRETGPQVADTFGALASAVVQIVQAAAPLGGPVLAGVEAFANAISAIADSNLGTPIMAGVAALALYNRALQTTMAVQKRVDAGGGLFGMIGSRQKATQGAFTAVKRDVESLASTWATAGARTTREQQRMADSAKSLRTNMGGLAKEVGRTAGPVAGLAVISSGAADGLGLTNTASLALMASWGGPPAIAIGAGVGLLMDLAAAGDGATAAIDGLAAAAQSGDVAVMAAQVAEAKKEMAELAQMNRGGGGLDGILDRLKFGASDVTGGKMDEARQKYEQGQKDLEALTKAQQLNEIQSRASAIAYASQAGVWMTSAEWARKSTDEIKAQADALIAARDAAYKTASSFVTLGDSLSDGKVSLSEWITQMSNSADALINFTRNSRKAAKNGLDEGLIASLQDAGEQGALRMRQLANATDAEIERANRAWRKGQRAMEDYVNFKVPPKRLDVDVNPGMNNIRALEARLRGIKDEDVFINVRQIGSTTLGPRNEAADGTTVPKTGKPYADRHLYLLADGEEVVSNRYGQADRYRPLLKDINANRLADGGTTGKKPRKVGVEFVGSSSNMDALVAAQYAAAQASLVAASDQAAAARDQLRAAEVTEEAARQQKDAAEQQLRATEQQQAAFASQVRGNFERNPFGSGFNAAVRTLNRDTAGASEFEALLRQLEGLGLDGAAYGALAGSGDTATARGMLSRGTAGVDLFESAYAGRESALGSLSKYAADNQFAEALAQQAAQLAAATATQDQHAARVAELAGSVWAHEAAVTALRDQVGSLEDTLRNMSQRPIEVNGARGPVETAREIARLERAGV